MLDAVQTQACQKNKKRLAKSASVEFQIGCIKWDNGAKGAGLRSKHQPAAGGPDHIGMHERCSSGTCMRGLQPVEHRKASQRQVHEATTGVGGFAER